MPFSPICRASRQHSGFRSCIILSSSGGGRNRQGRSASAAAAVAVVATRSATGAYDLNADCEPRCTCRTSSPWRCCVTVAAADANTFAPAVRHSAQYGEARRRAGTP